MTLAEVFADVLEAMSSSAGSALVGALVGGVATYVASRAQTERTIRAGTEQYRLAAQEQRELARQAAAEDRAAALKQFGRTGVLELLDALAMLDSALPYLRGIGWGPRFPGQEIPAQHVAAYDSLDALRRVEFISLPAVDDERLLERWAQLTSLVAQYRGLERGSRETLDATGKPRISYDGPISRAQMDVQEFIRYVRASASAWLHDADLPGDVAPPALARDDLRVWRWQEAAGAAARSAVADAGRPAS